MENRYYEDVLFVYKGVMKSEKYLIADFPVYHYISGRKNSMTTTLNLKNIYDTVDNIKDIMEKGRYSRNKLKNKKRNRYV